MFGADRYFAKHRRVTADGPNFDQMFDDDFFGHSRDPFEEMRRMQDRMLKQFGGPSGMESSPFDSWYQRKFGGSAGEVQRREDDENVYYEIALKGLKKGKVDVKVENGQIAISGEMENKSDGEEGGSYVSSTFHRSFPVPPDVDGNKAQMEQKDGKIIIKFPKLKA